MKKIVFGPITSRRFGQSLGIDLSPDKKQCNFDCVYCELIGAKPVDSIDNQPSIDKVVDEVKEALKKYKDIDVITLTANGEPTLYENLGGLISKLDEIKGDAKTLILSNGANIVNENIANTLLGIDIVKLSLDAATQKAFKKIDRPLQGIEVENIIESMVKFRSIYNKEFVVEILVVKGINDKSEEFEALKIALDKIKPDRIDISTIDRPPAYKVEEVTVSRLKELSTILEGLPVSIAYKKDYSEEKREFNKDEILNLLDKRPQSFEDVRVVFAQKSLKNLEELRNDNLVYVKDIAGVNFYKKK